jgi:hypothetical protein
MATRDSDDRLVMIEGSLWWNFERFCNLHGYVMTGITGTEITYVHKPGSPPTACAGRGRMSGMAKNADEFPIRILPGALDSQVGKTVPLRLGAGGPVVGRATLREGGRVEMTIDEPAEPETDDDDQDG